MKPFGFALGALTGAAAVLLLNRQGTQRVRPVAKAAMKAAVMAYHEARVQGAELAEAAEDLFAEAKTEAAADIFAAAVAAAQAKAAQARTEAKTETKPEATSKPESAAPAGEAPASRAVSESA
ncbi:DUF5132 domain-containing protein [Methylocystis sp. L43]|jgi:hypothetical protein|uniref:DUF5132 domain-containing protein n=1 Tax=unclassified Methylocystis TaxID=2625913 RepID=UPI0018C2559A|nr:MULTISPECIES: DUF5132 domain-containing protein [unclassified Methylocystis]MBG0798107.1 DUF5132 domain-containing protein [Methylocystis sp. L43]MBG0805515.1 DUF5132 domain-containing protein [Methylocystis sp. H15]